jgi:hypothetical protein
MGQAPDRQILPLALSHFCGVELSARAFGKYKVIALANESIRQFTRLRYGLVVRDVDIGLQAH